MFQFVGHQAAGDPLGARLYAQLQKAAVQLRLQFLTHPRTAAGAERRDRSSQTETVTYVDVGIDVISFCGSLKKSQKYDSLLDGHIKQRYKFIK